MSQPPPDRRFSGAPASADSAAAPWDGVAYYAAVEDPSVTAGRRASAAPGAPLPAEGRAPRRWWGDAIIVAFGALIIYAGVAATHSFYARLRLLGFMVGGLMLVRGLTGAWPERYWPRLLWLLYVLAAAAMLLAFYLLHRH